MNNIVIDVIRKTIILLYVSFEYIYIYNGLHSIRIVINIADCIPFVRIADILLWVTYE